MDHVTFGRNGPYGETCRLDRYVTTTIVGCDIGAESDVYECLLLKALALDRSRLSDNVGHMLT